MRSADALTTLEELGAGQWGLVTTGQAESYGVSRVDLGRLRDNGRVDRLRRGVYALPSSDYGPLQDLRAAWLATNPRATAEERVWKEDDVAVSHVSAASVHELGDLVPSAHEFTSRRRRQSVHQDVRFHRFELLEMDRTLVDGLLVTSVLRTVEDLASSGTDLDHLADVVRDALAKPEVHPSVLARRLDRLASRYGHDTGQALVDDCLDRAGLPAVAANLAGSNALAAAFVDQLSSHTRTAFLDSLVRYSITPQLREAFDRTLGTVVSEQMSQFTAQYSPGVQAMQDHVTEVVRKSMDHRRHEGSDPLDEEGSSTEEQDRQV